MRDLQKLLDPSRNTFIRRRRGLRHVDLRVGARRDGKTDALAFDVENGKEGREEGVAKSHRVCVLGQGVIELLDEDVTVSPGIELSLGGEVFHGDSVIVVSQLNRKVAWQVDLIALNVSPVAELIVLPSVAVHLVHKVWVPSIENQIFVSRP